MEDAIEVEYPDNWSDRPWPEPYEDFMSEKKVPKPYPVELKNNPLDEQAGGNHYKDMAIQPTEYITKNKLGFIEGNIVKYISRWRFKNGIEDLKKIKHYVDLLIEYEGLEPKGEGTNSGYVQARKEYLVDTNLYKGWG